MPILCNLLIRRQLVVDNDVDGEVLAELTEDQLTELGISSFGHRCGTLTFPLLSKVFPIDVCPLLYWSHTSTRCSLAHSIQDLIDRIHRTLELSKHTFPLL